MKNFACILTKSSAHIGGVDYVKGDIIGKEAGMHDSTTIAELYGSHPIELGRSDESLWKEIVTLDPRVVLANELILQAASATYAAVVYSAVTQGAVGNSISLVFDGVKTIADVVDTWNTASLENQVGHDAGDDTVVPAAGTADLIDGEDGGWEFVVDAALQTNADAADLAASKAVLGAAYIADVYDELFDKFSTRRDDTMNANMETWKMMSANASAFSSQGLVATRATTTYTLGDALDDVTKTAGWANECLADVELYAVWRSNRQKTYNDAIAALQ